MKLKSKLESKSYETDPLEIQTAKSKIHQIVVQLILKTNRVHLQKADIENSIQSLLDMHNRLFLAKKAACPKAVQQIRNEISFRKAVRHNRLSTVCKLITIGEDLTKGGEFCVLALDVMKKGDFGMLEELLKHPDASVTVVGWLMREAQVYTGWETDALAKRKAAFTCVLKQTDPGLVGKMLSSLGKTDKFIDVEGLGIDGLDASNLDKYMWQYYIVCHREAGSS